MTRDTDRNRDGRDPQGLGAKPESRGRQASPDLGRTNLTDRLGELVDKVTPGPVDVYPQPIGSADDAKAELAFQVDTTEDRQPFLFLLNAGGKCPATTGCGPTSQANAEFIALCFTHKGEILSALRKAEEPMSGDYAELVGRLRAIESTSTDGLGNRNPWWRNPDGPEAATAIERLTAREAELREALEWYADPKNWWTRNSSSLGWHQTGEGSMERHAAQVGTVSGKSFVPDCGGRARLSLGDEK